MLYVLFDSTGGKSKRSPHSTSEWEASMIPVQVMGGDPQPSRCFVNGEQRVRQARLMRDGRKPCQSGGANLFKFAE
jgi:hypothetical protein